MNHDLAGDKLPDGVDDDAEHALSSEGGHVARESETAPAPSDSSERAHLMSEFSIHYDGRHYRYGGYRCDQLADAVAYARRMRSRSSAGYDAQSPAADDGVEAPDGLERQIMARFGISFEGGVYEFEGLHYDRLADAVSYAQLRRHIGANERKQIERG